MNDKLLDKINYLARKSRSEGLSTEEIEEQKDLREKYIAAYRSNLKSTLDTIVIVDPEGNRKPLKKD